MSGGGRAGLGLALAISGGLLLAGASMGAWARETRIDDVAGVPIESTLPTPGVELAPLTLPLGILAAALGFGLAVRVPAIRRTLGALLLLVGGLALVLAARGAVLALELGDRLEPAGGAALIAALAVAAAGLVAIRAPSTSSRGLPARYDLDVDEADREWDLASAEEDEDRS